MRKLRRRRKFSLTSLIDVIFLLLLFFMLSSTFSRFAEVDLASASAGGAAATAPPVFLSLAAGSLRLNGTEAAMDSLSDTLAKNRTGDDPLRVVVAAQADVTAQRLTDLLVALRAIPDISVAVLEAS